MQGAHRHIGAGGSQFGGGVQQGGVVGGAAQRAAQRNDLHEASRGNEPAMMPGRQRANSSALLTTLTLDRAIAAPASTGLSAPKAASGMPTTL
mmetsp:Transcript_21397/g.82981  ORF Transcript_21397/g.82981 Transcript_21397/m.82981 type:complete len:93 (+) Transcript_21397:614-892(+)